MRLFIFLVLMSGWSCTRPEPQASNPAVKEKKPQLKPESPPEHQETFSIKKGSTCYSSLIAAKISPKTVLEALQASNSVHSLNRVPANTSYTITWESDQKAKLKSIVFKLSTTKELRLNLDKSQWTAELHNLPVSTKTETFSGVVQSSLWESASDAGMKPELIVTLTEIFAWQVDFSREVRVGDRWRIIVERKYVEDKPIGWGYILAAEYTNRSQTYTGIRFPPKDQLAAYYQADGTNLRRMFLKSPIKFGRISSRFSRARFHPILKQKRPHLGVDYAAPTGTPIRSVGDGRIVFSGRNGGSGKMIKIKHNSIYATAYLHMSRFAKGMRRGTQVKQGQVIGYVGSTGWATGPHLHFSFYKRGQYVDPLRIKFPSAKPISSEDFPGFTIIANDITKRFPDWNMITATKDEELDKLKQGQL